MKYLLDEQISDSVATRLHDQGIDAIAVCAEAKLRGLPDRDIFARAQEGERAVVTYDRDFLTIAAAFARDRQDHHGVLMIHPFKLPSQDVSRLVDALKDAARTLEPYPSFVYWLP